MERQRVSKGRFDSPFADDAHSLFMLHAAYGNNLHKWATSSTPNPRASTAASRTTRSTRATKTTTSREPNTPTPRPYTPPVYQPPPPAPVSTLPPNPPRPPLPTTTQALHSTYASRLRTGATLLVQPILPTGAATTTRTATRRGGIVSYVDPGSGDEEPDAGALESDDSDFVASGGLRTALRQNRMRMSTGMSVFHAGSGVSTPQPQQYRPERPERQDRPEKTELDQSYLGMVPPSRFIKAKPVAPTAHEYP